MSVCYTAIFGPYDDLKKPRVITPGWRYIAFTDQDLHSDVWEVKKIVQLPGGAQRMARFVKILAYQEFEEPVSIWVDGTFIINCNLDKWIRRMNGPLTVVRHPVRDCVYEEAKECIEQQRGNFEEIARQVVKYKDEKMPAHNGLISTGVMMRNNVPSVATFCDAWWAELSAQSARDQLSFAHTAWRHPNIHSTIRWDYQTEQEFLHVPHMHNPNRIHRLKALGINQ